MRNTSKMRTLTGLAGALSLPLVVAFGAAGCTTATTSAPVACSISVSPNPTLENVPETVIVKTTPGAMVTTSLRYPGGGRSDKVIKTGPKGLAGSTFTAGTHPGKVTVMALAVRGSSARLCTSSFTVANGSLSYTLTQKPKCAEGTAFFRAPTVPAIVSWNVTGATGVDLYVDGDPGLYGSYGPTGSQAFTFSCSGKIKSIEKHSYTLKTTGGVIVSETINTSSVILDNGGGIGSPNN